MCMYVTFIVGNIMAGKVICVHSIPLSFIGGMYANKTTSYKLCNKFMIMSGE